MVCGTTLGNRLTTRVWPYVSPEVIGIASRSYSKVLHIEQEAFGIPLNEIHCFEYNLLQRMQYFLGFENQAGHNNRNDTVCSSLILRIKHKHEN